MVTLVQLECKGNIWSSCFHTFLIGYYVSLTTVIFLPARPASQTHDSHKGHMIFNHESPAGRIKNCGEKSALSF